MRVLLSLALTASFAQAAGEIKSDVEASPFRISTQGHGMFLNSTDNEDSLARAAYNLLHENKVSAEFKDVQADLTFTNRWNPNGNKENNSFFTVEKKTLSHAWSDGKVEAGDSHQELGRGIALSLYRDSAFGVDNTLEGVALKQSLGQVKVSALAGRINSLNNPVALNPITNPLLNRNVWLAGAQSTVKATKDVEIGGHYLFSANKPNDASDIDKKWHTAGIVLACNGLANAIDLYGETNVLLTEGAGANQVSYPTGNGSYLSAAWSEESWRVKAEVKDYRKFYYDFRRPPTLEDDVVVTLNTQDVTAARFAVERGLGLKTNVYASFLAGHDRIEEGDLRHGIIGGKWLGPLRSAFEAKLGYRWVVGHSNLTHGGLKLKVPTFKGQSAEFEYRKQIGNKDLNRYRIIEDRNQTTVGYNFNEQWNAGVGYEFLPTAPPEAQAHFFNVNGTYKTGAFITKAFVGQTSGGTLCSAGVCRQVPPFSGAYLEGTYQF